MVKPGRGAGFAGAWQQSEGQAAGPVLCRLSAERPGGNVRAVDAAEPEERWCQVGSFEPMEAKRVIPLFEQHQVPFEMEADHSRLQAPFRFLQLEFGLYPEGSKLLLFVPEKEEARAQQLLATLFPV